MACEPSSRWDLVAIARELEGDQLAARVEQLRRILADYGMAGRIGFYGHGEIGQAHALLQGLAEAMPESEIAVEFVDDLFTAARVTKDAAEIAAMEEVGLRSNQVVAEVAEMLSSRPVAGDRLLAPGGEPLTIGQVKAFIQDACGRRGLEQPSGNIFAQAADAAVPHNAGNPEDVLRLGRAIIFDFYPRPVGGGYYHDMTRTWCLGHASDEVQQAYADVMGAFSQVVERLEVGQLCAGYQVMTCDYFAARGHPTILSDPSTEVGYVHGLGHGLGLEVHEEPSFAAMAGNTATLQPGMAITVEPGLYYEARGFGVRVEDTYVCDLDGSFRSITPFPKDLVLPVRGA
jgi:Xaa-Pro aminopeptidase